MWTVYTHRTFCTVYTFAEIAHFVSLMKRAHLDNFHRSPQLGGFEMKTLIRWEAKSVTEHSCHLLRFIRLSPSFLKIMIVFFVPALALRYIRSYTILPRGTQLYFLSIFVSKFSAVQGFHCHWPSLHCWLLSLWTWPDGIIYMLSCASSWSLDSP